MLAFLPAPLKGVLAFILFSTNTVFWCLLLYPFALVKFLIPVPSVRNAMNRIMVGIAENWISVNSFEIALLHKINWDIRGIEKLSLDKSYLVSANHQSWVDIVVLQHAFNRRIPFLRFFLKKELIYIPFLGAAWWALDFPFMKRHSKEYLAKHPEKRGEDLKTTQRACERFRGTRISVLNFLEGTRFTQQKHLKQKSPYKHLLPPKTGGVAFVLEAMGDQFDALLDVTIHYPEGAQSLWGLFTGKLNHIIVNVERVEIPKEILKGGYLENTAFRTEMQGWVTKLWEQKDRHLTEFKKP